MITIRMVQERLAALGLDPGPVDGVRGRMTIAALRAFQADRGLAPDGLLGPLTAQALFPDAAPADGLPDGTPWMDVAERVMGLHETLDRRALSDFLASDGGTAGDPSQVPWCADYVQTCVALAMPDEPLPNNPYMAANWARFGRPVEPCFGAILSLWREAPGSWKGHVGFCVAVERDAFVMRGGNQADRISEIRVERQFLREGGARWPLTALPPA